MDSGNVIVSYSGMTEQPYGTVELLYMYSTDMEELLR